MKMDKILKNLLEFCTFLMIALNLLQNSCASEISSKQSNSTSIVQTNYLENVFKHALTGIFSDLNNTDSKSRKHAPHRAVITPRKISHDTVQHESEAPTIDPTASPPTPSNPPTPTVTPTVAPVTFEPTVYISPENSIVYPDEVYIPTADEISRAITIRPAASWGVSFRADKSLRILCLGGSNTLRDMNGHGYVANLDRFVKHNVSSSSYALNEGMGGQGAAANIGRVYKFQEWETSRWPNLVTFEFSVNSGFTPSFFDVDKNCDRLMRSLMHKYRVNNVTVPEFLVFELFNVAHLYGQTFERSTIQSRVDKMQELSANPFIKPHGSGFNRGSTANAYLDAFAKFYGLPVVSWNDVAFPSFLRHFTSSGMGVNRNMWPYSDDGMHLNARSAHFVVDYLLGPFLAEQMKPRHVEVQKRSADSHLYNFDLHMFKPESSSSFKIVEYNSWMSNSNHTLRELVASNKSSSEWRFMQTYAHQKDHGCYCSSNTSAPALLVFDLPAYCSPLSGSPCSISLGLVRSWNESYIGTTKCQLFQMHTNMTPGMQSRDLIHSVVYKGSPFTHTAPEEHVMSSAESAGKYLIECYNLEEMKLTCLTSVSISGVVTL